MLLLPPSAVPFYSVHNFMLGYRIIGTFNCLIFFFPSVFYHYSCYYKKRSRLLGKQLITRQYDTHRSQPWILVLLHHEATCMDAELAVEPFRCPEGEQHALWIQWDALRCEGSIVWGEKSSPTCVLSPCCPTAPRYDVWTSAKPPRKANQRLARYFDSSTRSCFGIVCWSTLISPEEGYLKLGIFKMNVSQKYHAVGIICTSWNGDQTLNYRKQ